jgi:threonine synthase
MIAETGGWAEDVADVEIVSGIQELAETEGIFTETAGGVTTAVTARLYAHGRIGRDETTVVCITGNGLKTTDALAGCYAQERAVKPRLAAFDEYIREVDGTLIGAEIGQGEELVPAGGVQ